MLIIDDKNIPQESAGMVIVNPVGERCITHAIHDVDGTHSLIRDWHPVMSICLHYASHSKLDDGFDSETNRRWLISNCGRLSLPETDKFSIESAGLSALTQMEWAIRRGFQLGKVEIPGYKLTYDDLCKNDLIINCIWHGLEVFEDIKETPAIYAFLNDRVPRLFRLYEDILNRVSRNKNIEAAKKNPEDWRIPGSFSFLEHLYNNGVKNYFVTGAVVEKRKTGKPIGMLEEVLALGYKIGEGKMVENIYGSNWDKKITKIEAMHEIMSQIGIKGENILIVGDGRAEINAAVEMNAVALSRLDKTAERQREIHRHLKTNYIVSDYTAPYFKKLFSLS